MKRNKFLIFIILISQIVVSQVPSYYSSIDFGQSGEANRITIESQNEKHSTWKEKKHQKDLPLPQTNDAFCGVVVFSAARLIIQRYSSLLLSMLMSMSVVTRGKLSSRRVLSSSSSSSRGRRRRGRG